MRPEKRVGTGILEASFWLIRFHKETQKRGGRKKTQPEAVKLKFSLCVRQSCHVHNYFQNLFAFSCCLYVRLCFHVWWIFFWLTWLVHFHFSRHFYIHLRLQLTFIFIFRFTWLIVHVHVGHHLCFHSRVLFFHRICALRDFSLSLVSVQLLSCMLFGWNPHGVIRTGSYAPQHVVPAYCITVRVGWGWVFYGHMHFTILFRSLPAPHSDIVAFSAVSSFRGLA